jgi:cytochrome c peroxidase
MVSAATFAGEAFGQPAPVPANTPLISQVQRSVPNPTELAKYVRDRGAALRLGKALFWDMQVGSDGLTACATCHFHAGADNRSKNQVAPGLKALPPDITFAPQLGGAPNRQLVQGDFPLHKLADSNDRNSAVLRDTNDVVSSQGVHFSIFVNATSGSGVDSIEWAEDEEGFAIQGINVRRVEPRNTPTVINAVFNRVLFWDGRAKATFNGVNPDGVAVPGLPGPVLYKATGFGQLAPVSVALAQSPLASLAVGPPLSEFEMSARNRPFIEIGDKFTRDGVLRRHKVFTRNSRHIRGIRPLGKQVVHREDSVLGAESRYPSPGLRTASYDALIRQAFRPEWWLSAQMLQVDDDGKPPTVLAGPPRLGNQYTLMEWNFSLFFGLALQEYMATLVDGNTPFDRFQKGIPGAMSEQQIRGLALFVNSRPDPNIPNAPPGVNCDVCHELPEFTRASLRLDDDAGSNGFRNIGVRPIAEDRGRQDGEAPLTGLFKTPTLRNVELTAPYMHNGGMATLRDVVDFYNRGRSDFDENEGGAEAGNLLNMTEDQKDDLIKFLGALTDDRVKYQRAPFDHPQLFVPNGHPVNQWLIRANGSTRNAADQLLEIPAVGRKGLSGAPRNFLNIQQIPQQ